MTLISVQHTIKAAIVFKLRTKADEDKVLLEWLVYSQWPTVFENTLITITPIKIKNIPISAGESGICLYNTALIAAIRTIPIPAQIAYATPTGMVFRTKDRQ